MDEEFLEKLKRDIGESKLKAKDALLITSILVLADGLAAVRDEIRELKFVVQRLSR